MSKYLEKQKTFFQFFSANLKPTLSLEHFSKKEDTPS